ncbi:MAG TPA: hypothetical protein VGA85_05335 [Dehalococcoidales bacterium]
MKNPFKRSGHPGVKLESVTMNVPYAGSATFVPEDSEIRAAWSLYIEISTRVPVQPVDPEYGSIREALNSIYALFGETRRILSQSGPSIAHGRNSLAPLAIEFLNKGLRPFLTKWHYELQLHESKYNTAQKSRVEYEKEWPKLNEFEKAFKELQHNLEQYQSELKKLCGARCDD